MHAYLTVRNLSCLVVYTPSYGSRSEYRYDALGRCIYGKWIDSTVGDGVNWNLNATPATGHLKMFTGRKRDGETGLYHYRARQ